MLCAPFRGGDGDGSPMVGASPNPVLFDPLRGRDALKGQYNIDQGLAPV